LGSGFLAPSFFGLGTFLFTLPLDLLLVSSLLLALKFGLYHQRFHVDLRLAG
jgi:hypothetical protein